MPGTWNARHLSPTNSQEESEVQQQTIKICGWCESMFTQARGRSEQNFCQRSCQRAWASAHRWDARPVTTSPCAVCGTVARQFNGKALCSDACRKANHRATQREWVQRTGFAAVNYQRHKHQWRVWNANRANRLVVQSSPHTTEAKIEARMDFFGRLCWVCGAPGVERDHVKPLAKGGAHMPCNIRPICRHCNRSKKDTWPFRVLVNCDG